MLLLVLACLAFVIGSFSILEHTKVVSHIVVALIGIVFFGLGGLYMLYDTIKERLTGKPFLTITDEAIISEGIKQTVIHFADVESFEVVKKLWKALCLECSTCAMFFSSSLMVSISAFCAAESCRRGPSAPPSCYS